MTVWPTYGARLPLWEAVYHQDAQAVQKLLGSKEGADQVNVPHGLWQMTSVHLAVQKKNAKILKYLLFVNADANMRNINGTTPLHIAVELKRKDLIQDLLLVGANPLLRNYTGKNAIEMAADRGMKEMVLAQRQQADSLPFQRLVREKQRQEQAQQQQHQQQQKQQQPVH
ncbi:TPA: hypothetical protein N0F65_010454 [Lagenidium giganteum]|uniref:Uncharacterized protein n=1 Tax=Lagenidium giganteum TaxID=4803 RepID=A0AAV2YUU3_9STRA|nr:TPA: hypothetical protein N0F65_010454 [Lagenidium giganteum]